MSWARGSGPVDMELQEALYEAATSDHESASSRAAAASSAAPRAAAGRAGSGRDAARPPARWSKLQTKSQILRYAYGQIEIEKAMMSTQNKGRSWKELLEVAAGTSSLDQQRRLLISGNERLRIEICFHDLSLYLKSNGKKILCNVTGKLSAGRVTAVMGPSGAGKTTFLNALAGKAYNSYTTGTVLINGRPDVPIQCYKKVIGFVAQDDIVHGNLTVEENLWFSARYRYVLPFLSLTLIPPPARTAAVLHLISSHLDDATDPSLPHA
jgi:ABC-type multidrug transport system fused ATPase/permease subunit